MLSIETPVAAQAAIVLRKNDAALTPEQALTIAGERFPNLCCGGILPRKVVGERVDLDDIAVALAFLARCRKTKVPTVHSFDLRRAVGDVQLGAIIVAATALGFGVHSWLGITSYAPHAVIAVRAGDVKRAAKLSQ